MKLSVVVPCYNEEEVLNVFYEEIIKTLQQIEEQVKIKIIFVDDGSTDKTLEVIKKLSQLNKNVKYISFSRNFGKEAAIYAGLKESTGDLVVLMDADLQDPPYLLIEMVESITNEGYDCVCTKRSTRAGEPPIRSFFANIFYKFINKISKTEIVNGARDYRMMTRQMVDAILKLDEYNRFSKGIFSWVGFKTKWLEYENVERVAGKTKWSFWGLLLYSLDGILAFSTVPLAISSFLGLLMCVVSLIFMIIIIFKTLLFGEPVGGYPSTISIISFIGGIQLFCIGILGQYLSKTYLEIKKRPIYITKEDNFVKNHEGEKN